MLARRGFLGTSLALSAGPALIEPMQRWLVPVPPARARAEPEPPAAARRGRPALRARAGAAGVHHRDVPPVGRPVRRRTAPQGGRRPAARGDRPAPGAAARGHRPKRLFKVAAELAELAGWMSYDVGPAAHRAEVLRARAARRQGGGRQAARLVHPVQHEPPDDPPRPARRRPGARSTSRSTAAATAPAPRTQAMLYAMEARAYANMGQPSKCKRAVRMAEDTFADVARLGRARSRLDPLLLRGRAARRERPLLPRPRLCRRPQPHLRLARRARHAQRRRALRQGRRAPAVATRSTSSAWPPSTCSSASPSRPRVLAEQALTIARKVRSERVNTRLRKTVDTAVRDSATSPRSSTSPTSSPSQLPETAEAV